MANIDDKLERIKAQVLGDATRSRDAILDQLSAEAEHVLAEQKSEIDKAAAERVRKAEAAAAQARDAAIARSNIEAKKRLLAARASALNDASALLADRLAAFARTGDYTAYLVANATQALAAVGASIEPGTAARHDSAPAQGVSSVRVEANYGQNALMGAYPAHREGVAVYLTPGDLAAHRQRIEALAPGIMALAGDEAMIGGCMAENPAMGIFADNTFRRKISMSAEELLKISGLEFSGAAEGGRQT